MSDCRYQENGYSAAVLSNLNEMRKMKVGCDCVIQVGKKDNQALNPRGEESVHYAVVAAASGYFKRLHLQIRTKEFPRGRFLVRCDVSQIALQQCIDFMYTGIAEVNNDTVKEVAELSHILELHGLKKFCFDILLGKLSMGTVAGLISLSRQCKMSEHLHKGISYWIANSDAYTSVKSSEKNMADEETRWSVARKLRKTSKAFRDQILVKEILETIDIRKFPCKVMFKAINSEIVRNEKDAAKYVAEAICDKVSEDIKTLTTSNYYTVREIYKAFKLDPDGLKSNMTTFFATNANVLMMKKEFVDMDVEDVLQLFENTTCWTSEEVKCKAIIKWTKHSECRHSYFPRLFDTIKLEKLQTNFIQEIKSESIVKGNSEVLLRLIDTLCDRAKDGSDGQAPSSSLGKPPNTDKRSPYRNETSEDNVTDPPFEELQREDNNSSDSDDSVASDDSSSTDISPLPGLANMFRVRSFNRGSILSNDSQRTDATLCSFVEPALSDFDFSESSQINSESGVGLHGSEVMFDSEVQHQSQ